MKQFLSGIFLLLALAAYSQDEEEETVDEAPVSTTEIGVDGYFGASNFGGSFGIGAKFGYKLNENVILGPSVRVQRSWYNNYGQKFGYTIYGGGAWVHVRFAKYLFAGTELEFLNTPNDFIYVTNQKTWVPTLFAGGGFSREFNQSIRINAGIFYDVIDSPRSPFRFSYVMRKQNGALIPLIYRIGFFFPL